MQNTSIVFSVAVLDKTEALITVMVQSRTRLFLKRELNKLKKRGGGNPT